MKLVWNDFWKLNFQVYRAVLYVMHTPVVYPHLLSSRICFDFGVQNLLCWEMGWWQKVASNLFILYIRLETDFNPLLLFCGYFDFKFLRWGFSV